MPKAIEVAQELRKLADALEKGGTAEIDQAYVSFREYTKERFKTMASLMPRPVQKSIDFEGEEYADYVLKYITKPLHMRVSCPQSLTCTLVEPAKPAVYKCDPILSDEEFAEVSQ